MTRDLLSLVLVLVPLTAAAAFSDLRTGLIPNRLVVLGLAAGSCVRWGAHAFPCAAAPLSELAKTVASSALGAGLCGLGPYLLFRLGAMGGGDVKLLAAVGAGAGPVLGIRIELWSFILAALYALVRVAAAGQLLSLLTSSLELFVRPFAAALPAGSPARAAAEGALGALRFAPAIFVATLLVVIERWGQA